MQTILGAGGNIGRELAKNLKSYNEPIKLVSRHPRPVNDDDLLFPCDITQPELVKKAIDGSSVVYLTIGLPYRLSAWKSNWPKIMRSVIDACLESDSRLVFFDNIYAYAPQSVPHLTETSPINPVTEKGKIRAELIDMIIEATAKKYLKALIARSADFYGPACTNSILTQFVFNPLSKGKKATWFVSTAFKHSFTYTPDAAKATAILGNTPEAFGHTWHLPTASPPLMVQQWIEMIAAGCGTKPRFRLAGKNILSIFGLFKPEAGEMVEMLYQFDRDYFFDSSKFEKHFNFRPTSYAEGIRQILQEDYGIK